MSEVAVLLSLAAIVVSALSALYARRSWGLAKSVADRDEPRLLVTARLDGQDVIVRFVNAGRRQIAVDGAGFAESMRVDAPRSLRFRDIPPFTSRGGSIHGVQPYSVTLGEHEPEERRIDAINLVRERDERVPPRYVFADDSLGGRVWSPLPADLIEVLGRLVRWERVWAADPENDHGLREPPKLNDLPPAE